MQYILFLNVSQSAAEATLHHRDTASVNWAAYVVKSWWCNVLAKSSVSINQPQKRNGHAALGSSRSQRSPMAVAINTAADVSRAKVAAQ